MAVNRFTNGAGGNTWGTAGNWSQGTIPTASDGHVTTFDATSPNCTVNASNRVCNSIDFTGYTNTITMTFAITSSSNIILAAGMGISGSASMVISAGTLTSNGRTWPNNFSISGTVTINGNFTITGSLSVGNGTINKTTSETITSAGLTYSAATSGTCVGTIKIILTGGTWQNLVSGSPNANIRLGISEVEIAGNVTIGTIVALQSLGTLTYTSGTVTTTGSSLYISGTSTINTNGITWNNVALSISSGATITLTSSFTATGSTTAQTSSTVINKTGSETFSASGITANIAISGTAKIILTGGTWSGSSTISNSLDFNGSSTVSGTVSYSSGTMTHVSGTITTTSSTLNIAGCTLDTSGITWNNVSLSNTTGQTFTINSTFTVSGTLTIGTGATTTFAGTDGFSVNTLLCNNTGATTINFKESITYTITTLLDCYQSRVGAIVLFTSSHATTKAIITLQNGATCKCLANFTRIDASGGRPIRSFNGTITDCSNCVSITDLKTVSAAA